MSNLGLRLTAAALGIPLLMWCAVQGGLWLVGLVIALQFLLLLEWNKIAQASEVILWPLSVGIAVAGIDVFILSGGQHWMTGAALLAVYAWVLIGVFNRARKPLEQLGSGALFILYAALPLALWIPLWQNTDGIRHGSFGALALLFAATWFCDSAAYFGGRAFGKHKLYPQASPNKTIEGAVSGLVGAAILLPVAKVFGYASPTILDFLALPAAVGIGGQLGDLIESLIKRESGLKDSSQLIPGHGGILDRFDSLLLSSPLFLAYLMLTS